MTHKRSAVTSTEMKNLQLATKTPKVSVYYLYPQPPKFEPFLEALLFSDPLQALPLLMPSYTDYYFLNRHRPLSHPPIFTP